MENELTLAAQEETAAARTAYLEELSRVGIEQEREAGWLHGEFERIASGGDVVNQLKQLSFRMRAEGRKGSGESTVITKFYRWQRSGRMKTQLISGNSLRRGQSVIPPEFIAYWQSATASNKRKCAPAWRKIIGEWRSGKELPGYGTWREYWTQHSLVIGPDTECPPELPAGLNYGTLMRYKPQRAELTLAREGLAAARKFTPHIIGTREGLRPLEYIAFDDVELDFLVQVPGVERPCKLRALVCKDVATDMYLKFVLRPAVLRDDGHEDGLKLTDMKMLVGDLLCTFGVPMIYVSHWILERGTATLSAGDRAAIAEISSGLVDVHLTTMISGRVLIGGYSDRAVGNSWGKAWLESGFNRLHNELAALPGQKGMIYQKQPAELEARRKYAVQLFRAGQKMSLAMRQELRLPFLDIYQATEEIASAMMRINLSEDHDCEGFSELQFWRYHKGDPWQPVEKLLDVPVEHRDRLEYWKRTETRMERWNRLTQGVQFFRMPESRLPRWLETHKEVRVEQGSIRFQLDGRDYTFFDPRSPLLHDNAKYLAYFDPIKPDWIYLTDGRGAYRGKLPRVKAVRRADQEALAAQFKQTRGALAAHVESLNELQKGQNEQSLAEMEHNVEVISAAQQAVQIAQGKDGGTLEDDGLTRTLAAETKARDTAHSQKKSAKKVNVLALLKQQAGEVAKTHT